MLELTEGARHLLEEPNIGHLATLMPDGSPHVTPVWVDFDGTHVLVNTAEGRVKWKNVRRDPRVALAIAGRQNPYDMTSIRGRVVEVTVAGADAHIDKLAKKYLGLDHYTARQPGEKRVILRIVPEHVITSLRR